MLTAESLCSVWCIIVEWIVMGRHETKRKRVDNPHDAVVEILNIRLGELRNYSLQSNEISEDLRNKFDSGQFKRTIGNHLQHTML